MYSVQWSTDPKRNHDIMDTLHKILKQKKTLWHSENENMQVPKSLHLFTHERANISEHFMHINGMP